MSNGDEDATDDGDADPAERSGAAETAVETEVTVESVDERLTAAAEDLDEAETETDLDDVDAELDSIAAELENLELPDLEEEDEDAEDPREGLESRIEDLRDRLEDQRGPYAADVVTAIEDATATVSDTRWTDSGHTDVVDGVERLFQSAAEALDSSFAAPGEASEDLAAGLGSVTAAVENADLDPDADSETIAELLAATEALSQDLEAAEEWDDLTVREQLAAEGFYDVLAAENRKDFPVEWNAIRVHAEEGNVEPILMGLETFDSDFMEENILNVLERMAPEAAYEPIHDRAQKRDTQPVAILGKIGDDRAVDTLHEFIDGSGDPGLQRVTLRSLGEIGSRESTQPVAERLAAEQAGVRSVAARALGLIGDTRAIEPLTEVLADDAADEVRASAAWALTQIGTERALAEAGDYADDRSYLVQAEAEKAREASEMAEAS
jgi:HEAT repeat protein/ElaB/YqjD/DUF883 family membrane-anchored ribosome-binding protein